MVAIMDAAAVYRKGAILAPLVYSRYSVLHNPDKFDYSPFGQTTYVREVKGGNAGDYTGVYGQIKSSEAYSKRTPFIAPYDRGINYSIDTVDELNALLQSETPNVLLIAQQSWKNLGEELDAVMSTTLYSVAKEQNIAGGADKPLPNILTVKRSDIKAPTLNSGLYEMLIDVKNAMLDDGYEGDIFIFGSVDYTSALEKVITQSGYAFANSSVLTLSKSDKINTPNNLSEDDLLSVHTSVMEFNEMHIFKVPSRRMISHLTLLDGVSVGQEKGGFVPNLIPDDDTFHKLAFTAVPVEGVVMSIRHNVANMTIPQIVAINGFDQTVNIGMDSVMEAVEQSNRMLKGRFEIDNLGINQTGDKFTFNSRIVWGPAIFETYKPFVRVAVINEEL